MEVSLVFGTRPETIKLSPLVLAFRTHSEISPRVCVTGQHREMLDEALGEFEIVPDVDLGLMQPGQSLAGFASRALAAIDAYLDGHKTDMVIVQGDTTSAFCAALCAHYRKIPVGHVEAGLRTGDRHFPFPEETNRVLTSRLADLHFAPTEAAAHALRSEGVPEPNIVVTGNPVIDALLVAAKHVETDPPKIPGLPFDLFQERTGSLVLVTGHRRESFGQGLENICRAVLVLSERFPETWFIYPVHLNPQVREPVHRILSGRPNIHLIEPVKYRAFIALLMRATLVLTDSGGVQEEAPSLGKPVLVMRDKTERPEAVAAGVARLVGTEEASIVASAAELLTDGSVYSAMAKRTNPYGDGQACQRIVSAVEQFLRERQNMV